MIPGPEQNAERNIVLIGLMGAGKTTLGRKLAKRLGRPLVDTDHEVERRCGTSIPVIFELEGEAGFRSREAKVIAEVMAQPGQVVTTGGGAAVQAVNQPVLSTGFVIYLQADPRQLWHRVSHDRNRPLLAQSADPRKTLEALYQERDPIYRSLAHAVVHSTQGTMGSVLKLMEQAVAQAGLLPPGHDAHDAHEAHAPALPLNLPLKL